MLSKVLCDPEALGGDSQQALNKKTVLDPGITFQQRTTTFATLPKKWTLCFVIRTTLL